MGLKEVKFTSFFIADQGGGTLWGKMLPFRPEIRYYMYNVHVYDHFPKVVNLAEPEYSR